MQNGQNTDLHTNKTQLVSCELYVFICFKRTYPPLLFQSCQHHMADLLPATVVRQYITLLSRVSGPEKRLKWVNDLLGCSTRICIQSTLLVDESLLVANIFIYYC